MNLSIIPSQTGPSRPPTNPAHAYLAGLAPSGRRTMATALRQAAEALTQGVGTIDTCPWHLLQPDHLVALKAMMTEHGAAAATVNRTINALRGVARSAWRAGQIDAELLGRIRDVPTNKVRTLPRGRHVTTGEVAALFRACDLHTAIGARDAALLALLYGAGVRRTEAVNLDIDHYDANTGTLTVHGKGRHQRHVWAANGARTALDAWITHRGTLPGPLLQPVDCGGTIHPRRLADVAVIRRLKTIARRADVKHLTPHDLRRSFVGQLLDNGADISSIQRLAGHATVATTQRYDRRPETAARSAAETLHVPVHVR